VTLPEALRAAAADTANDPQTGCSAATQSQPYIAKPKIQAARLEYDGPDRFAFDVVGAVADVLRASARFPQLSRFELEVLLGDLEREIARAVEEGVRREIREALEEEDD